MIAARFAVQKSENDVSKAEATLRAWRLPEEEIRALVADAENARLDAVLCGVLMAMVAVILADSLRVWYGILRGTRQARVLESPFVVSQLRAEEL